MCAMLARESGSEQNYEKLALHLRIKIIWKLKLFKIIGIFLEIDVAKICTPPTRENDLENQ